MTSNLTVGTYTVEFRMRSVLSENYIKHVTNAFQPADIVFPFLLVIFF